MVAYRKEMIRMWIWMVHKDERGLNTAELLGNAALAILALIAIWAALQALGLDIVAWIRTQLLG